jgi:hypothetical protein
MNNMYDILEKFNTVADRQTLTEGRAVREADVEEGNKFTGELAKARAAGKKQADLDGDGDMEPVKEAKKAKPDFLDMDQDGDKKEPMKKAIKDKAKKKSVKESLRLIKEADFGDRSLKVYHDREYQEYHVCVTEGNRMISREFAGSTQEVTQLVRGIIAEARGRDLEISPFDDPRTRFRKKFAPSVMGDPESRAELGKLDTEYGERSKTAYGRGEEDEDEEGSKKQQPAGEKRGRGRPKGAKRRIGAKGPTGRSKLLTREDYDRDEYDEEGEMAMSQARTIEDAAEELQSILDADENLPEWVQKKISMAKEYIDSARDYLKANRPEDSDMELVPEGTDGEFTQADWDKVARKKRHLMMLKPNLEPEDAEQMAAERLGYDYEDVLAWIESDQNMEEGSTGDYSAKKARAGKDIGKPGKTFAKIAKSAGERYGSKERGEKVAGAVLAKLRAKEDVNEADMDESALQAHIGRKKYGKAGMAALQQAGREGAGKEKMAKIRAQHDKLDEVDLDEKAVSKAQRAAAGIAYAAKKGDIPKSELRGASKEMARMPSGELKKFAKTKEKGLPAKKDEAVEETTTAGSVATAPAQGEKKSKGGIQFGKGVYEARLAEQFEREMVSIMNEGLDVSVTANADGSNTVSVTGKDVAPDVLMDLLKMAGMSGSREEVYQPVQTAPGGDDMAGMLDALDGIAGGQPDQPESMIPEQEVCEVCGGHEGMHEAGCDREMALEADLANSADNTETMSTDYMVDKLAGGVNGPKLQVNPNNMGDNPLAMKNLGKAPSGQINLGAIAEEIQQETENRLLDLYRKIAS